VKDSSLHDNFFLFPIALPGADVDFLKKIVDATPSKLDKYTDITDASTELSKIFIDIISRFSADYLVKVRPQNALYSGEDRQLSLIWTPNDEEYKSHFQYREGTAPYAKSPTPPAPPCVWFKSILIGFALILSLFLLLFFGVPQYKKLLFNN